jgi:hypothetical protein
MGFSIEYEEEVRTVFFKSLPNEQAYSIHISLVEELLM